MSDDNQQMEHLEFLRAQLFSSDADVAAAHTKKAVVTKAKPRRDPVLSALRSFVRALDAADERSRVAAIRWLADRYHA